MEVTTQEAYAEACQALGETLVAQRLMAKELGRLTTENAALRAQLEPQETPPS